MEYRRCMSKETRISRREVIGYLGAFGLSTAAVSGGAFVFAEVLSRIKEKSSREYAEEFGKKLSEYDGIERNAVQHVESVSVDDDELVDTTCESPGVYVGDYEETEDNRFVQNLYLVTDQTYIAPESVNRITQREQVGVVDLLAHEYVAGNFIVTQESSAAENVFSEDKLPDGMGNVLVHTFCFESTNVGGRGIQDGHTLDFYLRQGFEILSGSADVITLEEQGVIFPDRETAVSYTIPAGTERLGR